MRKRPALSAYVYPGAILVRQESEMLINLEWGMSNRENPAIGIEQERRNDSVRTMVRIAVPTIPDFECDVWCYEDKLGQGDDYPQADGSMILKHTDTRFFSYDPSCAAPKMREESAAVNRSLRGRYFCIEKAKEAEVSRDAVCF
mgnify:CR=1 FL=1